MSRIRGALIGCGFFARNQLHAWQGIEGVEIVAICDRDETRLAETGDAFGIAPRGRALRAARALGIVVLCSFCIYACFSGFFHP